MNKNVKRIFFVLTLMIILLTVSTVSATDLTDDTQLADTTQSNIVSDVSQAPVDNAVVKEEVSVTSTDKYVESNTKNIETKQDKNIKKSTKTVEVHDFDEFKTAMNDAVNDNDNDEYVINLETGTYTVTNTVFNKGTSSVNIIINGNNHTLNGDGRKNVPWFYRDAKGDLHKSFGKHPKRMLWNAFNSLRDRIQSIAESRFGDL